MRLENINACHVCGSSNLQPISKVPVPDIFTDEDILRDIVFCLDCETMHYIEDGDISYEFSCKMNSSIGKKIYKENE
jgi:hypothetical protein